MKKSYISEIILNIKNFYFAYDPPSANKKAERPIIGDSAISLKTHCILPILPKTDFALSCTYRKYLAIRIFD
jgi:hypothetical protein